MCWGPSVKCRRHCRSRYSGRILVFRGVLPLWKDQGAQSSQLFPSVLNPGNHRRLFWGSTNVARADGSNCHLGAHLSDGGVLKPTPEQNHQHLEHLWTSADLVEAPLGRGDSQALSSGASAGFVRAETCLEKLLSHQSRRKGFPKGPFRTGADKDPEGDFTPLSIDHRQPRETRPNIDMSAVSQGYVIQILVLRRKWIFLNSAWLCGQCV